MTDRHRQFDMAHALPTHPSQSHFDAATVTDHAAMLDPFILSAGTFPVLDRAENAFAKQSAFFRFEGAVIDRFGVLDFAFGPGANRVRRGHSDRDIFNLI